MTFALQSSTGTKGTSHLDFAFKPLEDDSSVHHLVSPLRPSILTVYNLLANVSNLVHRSPSATSINGTFVNDFSSNLSHFHPAIHLDLVVKAKCHDTNAWTRERKVHDTELNAVTPSFILSSYGTASGDRSAVDVAGNSFTPMEFRTQEVRATEQLPNCVRLREDIAVNPHYWASLPASCSGVHPIRLNVTVGPCSHEDPSEGRRRVGEILVRCGVITVSRMSSNGSTAVGHGDTSGAHLVDAPEISIAPAKLPFGGNDGPLIAALANWTSEWMYTFVIKPHLRGNFRFQYQGKPSRASTSVALRIHRVLRDVDNPVQVAIHALWYIGILTWNDAHDNMPASFLSIPVFRYLHNNGTFVAEDFMFRAFITCAMISDKTVNDSTLSTNTWNRLSRIPQVILNATEKYALSCLKWNVVMTQVQWQDTINYFRSCIKMGSAFDPFAYDETSPSCIMARYLDELIYFTYADETYISQQKALAMGFLAPQPIWYPTHWGDFNTAEWCPKNDPVINWKPRTMGIAPGADQNSSTFKIGTTAMDLLDSILGSGSVRSVSNLARPGGTSFCGSFGTIRARIAHTVKVTSACQNTSWFPSHG